MKSPIQDPRGKHLPKTENEPNQHALLLFPHTRLASLKPRITAIYYSGNSKSIEMQVQREEDLKLRVEETLRETLWQTKPHPKHKLTLEKLEAYGKLKVT